MPRKDIGLRNGRRTGNAKSRRKPPVPGSRACVEYTNEAEVAASQVVEDGVRGNIAAVDAVNVVQRPNTRKKIRNTSTVYANDEYDESSVEPYYIGAMDQVCSHCGAFMFEVEREADKEFSLCCNRGRVSSDFSRVDCPPILRALLSDPQHELYKHFHKFIRQYNSCLSFVSFGSNVIKEINNGDCGWVFRIHGQVHHYINNGIGLDGKPKCNQIYYYDPKEAAALRKGLSYGSQLRMDLLESLDELLRSVNPFFHAHKNMQEVEREMLQSSGASEIVELCLIFRKNPFVDERRYNAPTADEVSMVYKPGMDGTVERDFAVYMRMPPGNVATVRVQAESRYVVPMSYALLFPSGGFGWAPKMKPSRGTSKFLSMREFYASMLFERVGEFSLILSSGRLLQQLTVDLRMLVEQSKMSYIRNNQSKLLVESYKGLHEWVANEAQQLNVRIGKTVICPSSVNGCERNNAENFKDAMAMVQKLGRPDLFVTFTCNPDWVEVKENLKLGQKAIDRPDLLARVFKPRARAILDDINEEFRLGPVKGWCYTVEFQKRGLPHIHLLVIMEDGFKITEPHQIDRIITAELPDPETEPELFKIITSMMIHGPCDIDPSKRPCRQQDNDKCSKKYPQQFRNETVLAESGYPLYRRREGPTAEIFSKGRRVIIDNRWVVPYNKTLTMKYKCHINVEACVSIKSVKYLYKYIYKGGDRADMVLQQSSEFVWNEVEQYLDGIYMTPPQAAWQLFKGQMQEKSHVVPRLSVHLPNEHNVLFKEGDEERAYQNASLKQTQLTAFFELCKTDNFAKTLTYEEVPTAYNFVAKDSVWNRKSICNRYAGKYVPRIYTVSPKDIERYYLRMLLFHVKGPTSYEDVRTVDGDLLPSYRAAAMKLGLIEDDTEWFSCMEEAARSKMPKGLRSLLSTILEFNRPGNALELWEKFKIDLSEDFVKDGYSEEDAFAMAMLDLEAYMNTYKTSLVNFGFRLPVCPNPHEIGETEFVARAPTLVETLNVEQRHAFDVITTAVMDNASTNKCFFIDGPGGSGKTYTYAAVQSYLMSQGKKVMALATTGIAADLLHEGRTMHSGLNMPIDVDETTMVCMAHGSELYLTLQSLDMVIIDEASMMKANQLKYISELLKYVTGDERDFGGKVIVLGGDFRQTLPVIKGASASTVLASVIKNSPLWAKFKTLSLKTNVRAGGHPAFCKWLLDIGEGNLPSPNADFPGHVGIPWDYKCQEGDFVQEIYGDAIWENDKRRLAESIIVAPTNKLAWQLNDEALGMVNEPPVEYLSIDTAVSEHSDVNLYTPEYLHGLKFSGMPFHKLVLKNSAVIMLLRNLQIKSGLLNGTRLRILSLHPHLIRAQIMKGSKVDSVVFIPRIDCLSSDPTMPFNLRRRQFPINLSYAMTINKAQGQSFDRVGVYLPQPVFSHGQLYVALSRSRNPASLVVRIEHPVPHHSLTDATVNIVWKSVLSDSRSTVTPRVQFSRALLRPATAAMDVDSAEERGV